MLDKVSSPLKQENSTTASLLIQEMKKGNVPDEWKASSADPVFIKDMFDLYSGKRSGHATPHLFTRKNFERWVNPHMPNYYISEAGADLLVQHEGYYRGLGAEIKKDGQPLVMLELGVGGAAKIKTVPLAKMLGADVYYGIDSSDEAIIATLKDVADALPTVERRYSRVNDFNKSALGIIDKGHKILVQLGSPLSNFPGGLNDPWPMGLMVDALLHYRKQVDEGDYFVLEIDMNQDKERLDLCYSDPIHAELARGLSERTAEEAPVRGFSPDNYVYQRVWNPKNHLYAHTQRIVRSHTFTFDGEEIIQLESDLLGHANSYKPPQEVMDLAYKHSHWRRVDALPDIQGRLVHQILQATPL